MIEQQMKPEGSQIVVSCIIQHWRSFANHEQGYKGTNFIQYQGLYNTGHTVLRIKHKYLTFEKYEEVRDLCLIAREGITRQIY